MSSFLVSWLDWTEGLCSLRGVQGQESCCGLKMGSSSVLGFVGAYGIFTSVNDVYISDTWRIYCSKLLEKIYL